MQMIKRLGLPLALVVMMCGGLRASDIVGDVVINGTVQDYSAPLTVGGGGNVQVKGTDFAAGYGQLRVGGEMAPGVFLPGQLNVNGNGKITLDEYGAIIADSLTMTGGEVNVNSSWSHLGLATGELNVSGGVLKLNTANRTISNQDMFVGGGVSNITGSGVLTGCGAIEFQDVMNVNGNGYNTGGTLRVHSGGTLSPMGGNLVMSGEVVFGSGGTYLFSASGAYLRVVDETSGGAAGVGRGSVDFQSGSTVEIADGYKATLTENNVSETVMEYKVLKGSNAVLDARTAADTMYSYSLDYQADKLVLVAVNKYPTDPTDPTNPTDPTDPTDPTLPDPGSPYVDPLKSYLGQIGISASTASALSTAGFANTVYGVQMLDRSSLSSTGQKNFDTMRALFGGADGLSGAQATGDLLQIAGYNSVELPAMGLQTLSEFGSTIGQRGTVTRRQYADAGKRIASTGAHASVAPSADWANRMWVSGLGNWSTQNERDGITGYEYKAGGAALGYDRFFGPINVGAAFAYTRGKLEYDYISGDTDLDNYTFGLYGTYNHYSGLFLTAQGAYNYSSNSMDTYFNSVQGKVEHDNHTNSYMGGGEAGFDWRITNNFTLTPSVGLYYQEAKSSAYTTSGAFIANYGKATAKSLTLPVQLAAAYRAELSDCSAITFAVNGGYTHEFKDDAPTGSMAFVGTGQSFTTYGMKPGKDLWNIGAEIKYEYKQVEFFAKYNYDGRSGYHSNRVQGGFALKF